MHKQINNGSLHLTPCRLLAVTSSGEKVRSPRIPSLCRLFIWLKRRPDIRVLCFRRAGAPRLASLCGRGQGGDRRRNGQEAEAAAAAGGEEGRVARRPARRAMLHDAAALPRAVTRAANPVRRVATDRHQSSRALRYVTCVLISLACRTQHSQTQTTTRVRLPRYPPDPCR